MQKPSNITKHELIGLDAKVVSSKNKDVVGVQGKVTDETRETIKLTTPNGEKTIIKNQSKFQFALPNGETVEVNGELLIGRPEIRIKKQIPKKRV
jgi:ribonuclease P protein subunit POP4